MISQVHIFIEGKVQGVGFRAFTKKHAKNLGLVGWVRNLPSGAVEIVAKGEKEELEKLMELVKKGPFLAGMEKVEVVWENTGEEFEVFQIRK